MPPVGFEPALSAGERPQTYVLDRAATGTGYYFSSNLKCGRTACIKGGAPKCLDRPTLKINEDNSTV